ncbi:MAG: HAD family hydrolase [Oscillospiraceae bacterium]|nr:HAD family hydrolase [Oscillospiraceae bacterium]
MKYILFDLDGTLTDPFNGITNSFRYALDKMNLPVPTQAELKWVIGPPLRNAFPKLGVSPERIEEAVAYFREYFVPTGLYENSVYDGIKELLCDLSNKGYVLAVATSKVKIYAERILQHFEIAEYFTCVGGAELDGSRSDKAEVIEYVLEKLNVTDKTEVCIIGDREHDIHGARVTGITGIGVLWGYGQNEELKAAGADYIFRNINELREFFKC